VNMLMNECLQANVQIETRSRIIEVRKTDNGFSISTPQTSLECRSLVVACGGLSIPKMGASGFGYDLARQFGLSVRDTRAALVPLTFEGKALARYADLSGVALPVTARSHDAAFTAGMLFTHRGISGPAILQVSSYWQPGEEIRVDLLPGVDAEVWLQERRQTRPDAELHNVLAEVLPKRLAQRLCELSFGSKPMRQHDEQALQAIAGQLAGWSFRPGGSEGYKTAEVTLGGVDTDALSSTTMEVKSVPGLYFIGEVVDVTGHLGGFNFQWAWASGHAAGQAV